MGNPLLATANDIPLKKLTATLHKKRHSGRQKGILDFKDFNFINHLLQQYNKVHKKSINSSTTLLIFDNILQKKYLYSLAITVFRFTRFSIVQFATGRSKVGVNSNPERFHSTGSPTQ